MFERQKHPHVWTLESEAESGSGGVCGGALGLVGRSKSFSFMLSQIGDVEGFE